MQRENPTHQMMINVYIDKTIRVRSVLYRMVIN